MASSEFSPRHGANRAALNYQGARMVGGYIVDDEANGWSPASNVNNMQNYIQVGGLLQAREWIGCQIQGRDATKEKSPYQQYVTKFKVYHSNDGYKWYPEGHEYDANKDSTSVVSVKFHNPFYARAMRIYPTDYVGWPSMRFECYFHDEFAPYD
jgi:hypothetical protein